MISAILSVFLIHEGVRKFHPPGHRSIFRDGDFSGDLLVRSVVCGVSRVS